MLVAPSGAQRALGAWVEEYNSSRPHQALDMQSPGDRFTPVPEEERDVLGLKVPGVLSLVPQQRSAPVVAPVAAEPAEPVVAVAELSDQGPDGLAPVEHVGPVECERVVPACGNLQVAGKQFWLGPARSGLTVTFWADTQVIHLLVAGSRIKTVRSHLSVADLALLAARGGRAAGPSPLPTGDGAAFEVDRAVNNSGLVGLAGRQVLAAEILGGRQVSIRIDEATLPDLSCSSWVKGR
ncbi:integrase core domain-containing protein [Streptomyces sp. NPDC046862]|uniref:integrase core domain-containing protein n=1 Tax=Streptomyces sp. NPDC046862 TaxID=3154603 RepID=UPI0034533FEA